MTGLPALPALLASQKSVDVTMVFQAGATGSYSATFDSVDIAVLLTATVPVGLTCRVDEGPGTRPLSVAPVDFGAVERGSTVVRRVTLANQTSVSLLVPSFSVSGDGFALGAAPAAGAVLTPAQSSWFDVLFTPTGNGLQTGWLAIGDRFYPMNGTGVEPALPKPRLGISLAQTASAQQGAITVNLDAAARSSGSGMLSLIFQPAVPLAGSAADPAIAFASGGQSVPFTVKSGDNQGRFGGEQSALFQTGTTAGTLKITAQLGDFTEEQSVVIAPAAVGLTMVTGLRSAGAVEVDLTGFDNTRSAGELTFTFFDAMGNPLAPGAIRADGGTVFAGYFQSAAGGTFVLKAVFPVAGDASQIKAVEATVRNSAGTANSARTVF